MMDGILIAWEIAQTLAALSFPAFCLIRWWRRLGRGAAPNKAMPVGRGWQYEYWGG